MTPVSSALHRGSLELRGLAKSFADGKVIRGIDLAVAAGEFVVFVGPSGCGKSTLLRLIAGLEQPTAGSIHIDKRDVTAEHPARRGIAMVFQSYALYPHMSVGENMGFGLRMQGMARDEIARRVDAAAQTLQLTEFLDRKPRALSGGQRQRVAIGRAIVREPQVFLFDEPLSNLDAALRGQMRVEIARLHARLATTMIYVTHDQVEAMTLGTRIVVLNGGVIEQVGAPLELYHRPRNTFVAGFIGAPRMNLLPARLLTAASHRLVVDFAGRPLELPGTWSAAAAGARVQIGVRPEHFSTRPATPALPLCEARVTLVEQLGGEALVHAAIDGADIDSIVVKTAGAHAPAVGARLSLGADVENLHVFDVAGANLRAP